MRPCVKHSELLVEQSEEISTKQILEGDDIQNDEIMTAITRKIHRPCLL